MGEEERKRRVVVESLGWLTESTILPKKQRAIPGVGPSSILELKAHLYKSQEESKKTKELAGPILSVLLATAGAVMSIKKFENSFDNSHQRLGLALYVIIWVQVLIGFIRPKRGKKERGVWYIVHWMLGTIISLVGIINVYTGLYAYNRRTSKSTTLWTILFTAEVSFITFFYLFQDKWEYMQKQGVTLGNLPVTLSNQEIPERLNQKEMLPVTCGKRNALMNLFD